MKIINVPVLFKGQIVVCVPDHLSSEDAIEIAGKIGMARIVASMDNPDGPEEDAFIEYSENCSDDATETAEDDWDKCLCAGVIGKWALTPKE